MIISKMFLCVKFTSIFFLFYVRQQRKHLQTTLFSKSDDHWNLLQLPLIANDIRMMLKLLMMMGVLCCCSRRNWKEVRWSVERSLMVHFWCMMMHTKTQAQGVMSIVVRLWWNVIMTVWICVVGVCLLSLRVFFIPEK